MVPTEATLALRIVLDVLAMRGPDPNGGPFRMYAVEPQHLMSAERAALARQFAALVPPGTGIHDAPRLAAEIAPLVAKRTA
jgi:hypothetical protein